MSTLIGFDLETTGASKEDRPVQLAAVLRSQGQDRVLLNELINPCMPIHPQAQEVHRISSRMVEGMPDYLLAAWKARLVIDQFPGAILVTFNGRTFDIPMIDRALGYTHFGDLPQIDVLQFARRYFPEAKGYRSKGGRTLGELYQIFIGREIENSHDAASDVIATLDLLEAMRVKAGMTLEQVLDDQKTAKPYTIMPIGKYAGQLIDDVPRSWAVFMNDKPDLDQDLRATVDLILRRGR